jgi:hypothetical protein
MRAAATLFCIGIVVLGYVAPAHAMRVIQDQCNKTSGDGGGHTCPGENYLLIRFQNADGTCGDWICCPENPDGKTYDCEHGSSPAQTGIRPRTVRPTVAYPGVVAPPTTQPGILMPKAPLAPLAPAR